MFEISVKSRFSAAHRLTGYKGACSRLHGHNWEVTVRIMGRELDRIGILVDFKKVRKTVDRVLSVLDHGELNKLPVFAKGNPTSENIARCLYEKLSDSLNCARYKVSGVVVSETPGSFVSYCEDKDQPIQKNRAGR